MKRDPDTPLVKIFPDASLYVERGVWYVRVNIERGIQPERSTHVRYDKRNANSQGYATTRAGEIYRDLKTKHASGLPLKSTTIAKLAEEHLAAAKKAYEHNKKLIQNGLDPTEYILEGKDKSVWDRPNYIHHKRVIRAYITHKRITPLQKEKEPWVRYFDKPENNKSVELLTLQDINAWISWKADIFLQEAKPNKSPGTIRKQHIVMRHILKLARRKGLIKDFPIIPDPPQRISSRRRPEVSESQWRKILNYARDKYGDVSVANQKYSWLWYHFLLTIEHTGIRPWQTKKNAIRLDQIRHTTVKGNDRYHIWREDKGKEGSWVAAEPYWNRIYERILDFHQRHEIETEYLFPHPIDTSKRKKGDPIGSFNGQWKNMLIWFGWYDPDLPPKDRLAQYSIRHRYAGKRLRENPDIPIITLAKQMRTSPTMLANVYTHLDADRDYEPIVAGSILTDDVEVFGENGWIRNCKRNSKDHYIFYYQSPGTTVKEQPELTWEQWLETQLNQDTSN